MTGLNSPDKDDWMVVLETTDDGCTDPTGKDGKADLNAEDDDSWGSTRSSDSSPAEATEDSNPAAGTENGSVDWRDMRELLPPDEDFCADFTHSPPPSEPVRGDQTKVSTGIHNRSSSPIMEPVEDPMDIDMLTQLPRSGEPFLTMDNLKAHFPHLSEDELEKLIQVCRAYRHKAYSPGQGFDQTSNHMP